jgi:alkyl hydroperoxide reductase subunit AhpC
LIEQRRGRGDRGADGGVFIESIVLCRPSLGYDVTYPILSDPTREIALSLGMITNEHVDSLSGLPVTGRSVYVIDPNFCIRLIVSYPAS